MFLFDGGSKFKRRVDASEGLTQLKTEFSGVKNERDNHGKNYGIMEKAFRLRRA